MAITPLNQGGTGSDLSGTGGPGQVLKQTSLGANVSVGTLQPTDLQSIYGKSYVVVDGVEYTTVAQSISALPATGGVVFVPPGTYTGPQSTGSLTLTSVAASSGGSAVYTGTITGGASNGLVGYQFAVAGFSGSNNNGTFICSASSSTTLTLSNASATAETHAATTAGTQWRNNLTLIGFSFDPPGSTLHAMNSGWQNISDKKCVFTYTSALTLDSLQSLRLDGIEFDFTGASGDGIIMKGVTNSIWDNFSIYGTGTNTGIGLKLIGAGTSSNNISNCFFHNFLMTGFAGGCISIDGTSAAVTSNGFCNSWLTPGINETAPVIQTKGQNDGNFFYNTTISGLYPNGPAITINNSSTPNSDVGAGGLVFYGLELQPMVPSSYVGPLIQVNTSVGTIFRDVDCTGGLTGTSAQIWKKIIGFGSTSPTQCEISFSPNFSLPAMANSTINIGGQYCATGTGSLVFTSAGALSTIGGDIAAGRSSTVGALFLGLDGGTIFRSGNGFEFGTGSGGTGGAFLQLNQVAAPTPISGTGQIWCDSTSNRMQITEAGSSAAIVVSDVAAADRTARSANISYTPIYTPPSTGLYRVSAYASVTRAATSSSTLPAVNIGWQDGDSGTNVNTNFTATNTSNTVGANQEGSLVIYAKSGTALQYTTLGYVTNGATSMQYSLHLKIERL